VRVRAGAGVGTAGGGGYSGGGVDGEGVSINGMDSDEYVVNGLKWWTSGACDPRCKVAIFMGKTAADGSGRASQMLPATSSNAFRTLASAPGRCCLPRHPMSFEPSPRRVQCNTMSWRASCVTECVKSLRHSNPVSATDQSLKTLMFVVSNWSMDIASSLLVPDWSRGSFGGMRG